MDFMGDNTSLWLSMNVTILITTKKLQKKEKNSDTKQMHDSRRDMFSPTKSIVQAYVFNAFALAVPLIGTGSISEAPIGFVCANLVWCVLKTPTDKSYGQASLSKSVHFNNWQTYVISDNVLPFTFLPGVPWVN